MSHLINRFFIFICLMLISAISFAADPPTRVARISYLSGTVSFSPSGTTEWVSAKLNRPVSSGDHFWVDTNSKLELQMAKARLRASDSTDLTIFNLSSKISQFEITQGTINLYVIASSKKHTYEIDTPNVALITEEPGDYRIDVDNTGTVITIRHGSMQVFGENNAYQLESGYAYFFTGTNLENYETYALPAIDEFDRWCEARNKLMQRAEARHYVSTDVVGYEDLDTYGRWQESDYGPIWIPDTVPDEWAPYRYGHWEWIDPWGWTWIDYAPWGFAPFHYGRWVFIDEVWGWVPGPRFVEPVYAPALVVFVNFGDINVSIVNNDVAWIPLGPGDVYIPPYPVSQNYFTNINITNTVINNTYVTNIYNNPTTIINYRNKYITDALTVVPRNAFVTAKPVAHAILPLPTNINPANIKALQKPGVSPTPISIAGTTTPAKVRPPREVTTKPVVVKTRPAPIAIEKKQKLFDINQPRRDQTQPNLIKPITTPMPVRPLKPDQSVKGLTPIERPAVQRRIERLRQLQQTAPQTLQPATQPIERPAVQRRIERLQQLQQTAPQTLQPATQPIERPAVQRRIERLRQLQQTAPQTLQPATQPIERPAVQRRIERLQQLQQTAPQTIQSPEIQTRRPVQVETKTIIQQPPVQQRRIPREQIRTMPAPLVTPYPTVESPAQVQRPNNFLQQQRPAVQRRMERLEQERGQPIQAPPQRVAPSAPASAIPIPQPAINPEDVRKMVRERVNPVNP